ncbi:hypothetical protein ACPA9J_01900 [Pseudomonas aeruginosa]
MGGSTFAWKPPPRVCASGVRDTGIGIAQEALDRIFQPFTAGRRGYHPPIRRHRPRPGPHAQVLWRGHAGRADGGVRRSAWAGLFTSACRWRRSASAAGAELRGRVIAQCSANSGRAAAANPAAALGPGVQASGDRRQPARPLARRTDIGLPDCLDGTASEHRYADPADHRLTAVSLNPELARLPRRRAPTRPAPLESQPVVPGPGNTVRLKHTARKLLARAPRHHGEQRNTRVLLVEDNPVITSWSPRALLHKLGRQVWIAEHGLNALKSAGGASHRPVLMDCNMPVMDGLRSRPGRSGRQRTLGRPADHRAGSPTPRRTSANVGLSRRHDDYLAKPSTATN